MSAELKALVEQAAQALFANSDLYRLLRWEDTGDLTKDMWRRDALAAIRCVAAATREANEGMIHAAPMRRVAYGPGEGSMYPGLWRAMHAASVLGEALRDGAALAQKEPGHD
jgi:hypothetical protein